MLLSQNRGRYQDGYLSTFHHGNERSAQGYFRLAEAGVVSEEDAELAFVVAALLGLGFLQQSLRPRTFRLAGRPWACGREPKRAGHHEIKAGRMTCTVRDDSVQGSWRVATEVFAPLRTCRIRQAWCGLEGQSADGVPLIGPVPGVAGLYVAAGFSGHGFQLSPAVGAAVAASLHGEPAVELHPLSPTRAGAIGTD